MQVGVFHWQNVVDMRTANSQYVLNYEISMMVGFVKYFCNLCSLTCI